MAGTKRTSDAFNRGLSRHRWTVAVIALLLSALMHAVFLAEMDRFPIGFLSRPAEVKRYVSIEMTDVLPEPPVVEDLVRPEFDDPSMAPPPAGMPDAVAPPASAEPVRLPLPEPESRPSAPVETIDSEPLPAPVRQDVLAIQEQLFSEDVAALPRAWVDQELPVVAKAPDIQLPMTMPELPAALLEPQSAGAASFVEDLSAETPDWTAMMNREGVGVADGVAIPSSTGAGLLGILNERPDEVSDLKPIENLLQIRVSGFTPPDGTGDLFIALQIERASETELPVQPRDVLFIQDSSESMTPWKLDECRRGLKRWLDFLNPGDRFEILSFRDDTTPCFGGWREFDPDSKRQAMAFIDSLRASGNTDVYRSLQSALSIRPEAGRAMVLVLVTDGRPTVGVTGSTDIIDGVTRANAGQISMFSVGGGRKVNSFFLDLLSFRNRGEAMVVRGDEEIPGAMESWARQLRRPVLTDLGYRFSGVDQIEVYPRQLTHLFLDRPLIIHGRLPAGTDRFVFQVVGQAGNESKDMLFVVNRSDIAPGPAQLRTQWAWQKVYHMIGDYIGQPTPEGLEDIRRFSDYYQLVVPYGFSRALPRGER